MLFYWDAGEKETHHAYALKSPVQHWVRRRKTHGMAASHMLGEHHGHQQYQQYQQYQQEVVPITSDARICVNGGWPMTRQDGCPRLI